MVTCRLLLSSMRFPRIPLFRFYRLSLMSRIHDGSPLWICCCCGGLPFLGLLKALILAPIPVLMVSLGCFLTSVSCLPHDVYLSYSATWTTAYLGRNLRTLILLALPVMLISWPFIVLIGCTVGSLFYFCGTIAWSVFDDDVPLCCGGVTTPFEEATKVRRMCDRDVRRGSVICPAALSVFFWGGGGRGSTCF